MWRSSLSRLVTRDALCKDAYTGTRWLSALSKPGMPRSVPLCARLSAFLQVARLAVHSHTALLGLTGKDMAEVDPVASSLVPPGDIDAQTIKVTPGQAHLGDLRSTSGLGLGDGLLSHTSKWLQVRVLAKAKLQQGRAGPDLLCMEVALTPL